MLTQAARGRGRSHWPAWEVCVQCPDLQLRDVACPQDPQGGNWRSKYPLISSSSRWCLPQAKPHRTPRASGPYRWVPGCRGCRTDGVSSSSRRNKPRVLKGQHWPAGKPSSSPPPEPWGWQGGHSLALGLLTRRPHEGEEGNLIPLFVNLRKPNKLSFLQARPIFALDIWKTLPDFPISDDGPQLTWDWVPWPLRNVTSDGQRDS